MGQGIGLALRGLRPIAEIQYLDYLLYGLQPLSDDVCNTALSEQKGSKVARLLFVQEATGWKASGTVVLRWE